MTTTEIELLKSSFGNILNKYKDVPVEVLINQYNINVNSKSKYSCVTDRIINNNGLQELFSDEIIKKTVHLDKYGRLKESVSLRAFEYCELVNQDWENSELHALFSKHYFVFFVFEDGNKSTFLRRIILWKMPSNTLESDVKITWETLKCCLQTGKIVKYIDDNGRIHTFFPGAADTSCVHVRPHAQSKLDVYPLPEPDVQTGLLSFPKHSFWLNRNFVLKIITKGYTNEFNKN